jgi:hypothetical protein
MPWKVRIYNNAYLYSESVANSIVTSVLDGFHDGFEQVAGGSCGAELAKVYGKEWEYSCFWGWCGESGRRCREDR